jgi:hypothetical protein
MGRKGVEGRKEEIEGNGRQAGKKGGKKEGRKTSSPSYLPHEGVKVPP